MEEFEFSARCAGGLESVLAAELKSYGIKRVRPLSGGVAFFGTLEAAYRACLWSRVASRILLVLSRFDAHNADALYEGAQDITWESHVGKAASIAVYAHGVNESLRNTQFTAVKVKDAMCDRLRQVHGLRPNVSGKRPDVAVDVAIRNNKAVVSIDLSGEPLHRRGYREDKIQVAAPLKENLAAGILLLGGWRDIATAGGAFIDPMCGSGTLAIEAAMIAADRAPGLLREYWGHTGWQGGDDVLWNRLIDEADERFALGIAHMPLLAAGDHDNHAVELAKASCALAGLSGTIEFAVQDASLLGSFCAAKNSSGLIACNPPYGERLASEAELPAIYTALAKGLDTLGSHALDSCTRGSDAHGSGSLGSGASENGWHLSVITPDALLDSEIGLHPAQVIPLRNGPIEAALRNYDIVPTHRETITVDVSDGTPHEIAVLERNSEQFAARLKKVAKERRKWARKADIDCYRIYDADLPDYSLAIDLYTGTGKHEGEHYIRIAEYQAPATVDPDRAERRWRDAIALSPLVLGIDPSKVFSKRRKREKGGGQYREARGTSKIVAVKESHYLFEVDMGSYLDTGIFLDHRITREMIGHLAQGKRFLNLFCYTGTATVYAAGGNAKSTRSVDLSQTYLHWAERNMVSNGFSGPAHTYVREDVVTWINHEEKSSRRYGLIFIDPPTFSNSKSMGKTTWSVQRDHASLLVAASKLLEEGGTIVFSCNLRSFKPDEEFLHNKGLLIEDISEQTIPHDFARNKKIHRCYRIRRATDING